MCPGIECFPLSGDGMRIGERLILPLPAYKHLALMGLRNTWEYFSHSPMRKRGMSADIEDFLQNDDLEIESIKKQKKMESKKNQEKELCERTFLSGIAMLHACNTNKELGNR